jgi:ABC-type polysaccharide/polyol phosphate export permease
MTDFVAPSYDSLAPRNRLKEEFLDLLHFRGLIRSLVFRNLTARYKRSILGILWALLNPLLTMLVMSVVFTALFQRQLPGFPVFLLSGLLAWNFFSQASSQAMTELVRGRTLIGRVNMPKSVFAITAVITGLINLLISFIPLVVLVFIYRRPITTALLFIPISLFIITTFTLGVGLFMSALAVFFNDMLNIYGILLRLAFYVSGVIHSIEMIPEELQGFFRLIPTYHLIVLIRHPVYDGMLPPLTSILQALAWSFVLLVIGFWVFTRYADEYIYRI